nr:hypothetical protein [uncultured Faecalicatena sp.]
MNRHVETVITMNRRGMGKVAIIMNMRRMTPGNTIIGMGIRMDMEESVGAGMIMSTGIRMNMEKAVAVGTIMRSTITKDTDMNQSSAGRKITHLTM